MAKKPYWDGKLKEKIDTEELASMFGLPSWDTIENYNIDYISDAYRAGEKEGGEAKAEEYEREAQDELFRKWRNAVEYAATTLFEQHGLTLQEAGPLYRIIPTTSWEDAARKILDTINGVGYFEFTSLRNFLESGPYTARQAVLEHLGYIKRRPEVYGDASARSLYDHSWR